MLSIDLLLAFSVFALIASVTPGPNNTMLMASGAAFGFRRTLPHMLGVTGGFFLMVLGIGFGFGAVFGRFPGLYDWLRYFGAAYLFYFALRIARSVPAVHNPLHEGVCGRPLGAWNAVVFQWVNPKAWAMAIAAVGTYTPQQGYLLNVLIIAVLFAVINLPCISLWVCFGSLIGRFLAPARQHRFNQAMALLLLASLYPMLV